MQLTMADCAKDSKVDQCRYYPHTMSRSTEESMASCNKPTQLSQLQTSHACLFRHLMPVKADIHGRQELLTLIATMRIFRYITPTPDTTLPTDSRRQF